MRYFNGDDPDEFFYEELFNNKSDRDEIKNLAKDPAYAPAKKIMAEKIRKYRESLK